MKEKIKHPDNVEKYSGSLEELAKDIGRMRYDSIVEFLQYLRNDLIRKAEADKNKRRTPLASKLEATAEELSQAQKEMLSAWRICAPYMTEDKK